MRGRRRHKGLALLLLLLLLACGRSKPLVAVTAPSAIVGNAQMRRGGTTVWVRVWPETILFVGDSLTAVDTTQIVFLDGTSLRLSPRARIAITRFDQEGDTLAFETEMASFEAQAASAHIQIAEAWARVRTESGQVIISMGGETQVVHQGQIVGIGENVPADEVAGAQPFPTFAPARPTTPVPTPQFVVSAPLINAAPSPTVTPRSPTEAPRVLVATPTRRPAFVVRVNCGGSAYTDSHGLQWSADRQYVAGQWGYTGGKIYTSGNAIGNTEDDMLYQSERWGDFFYLFDIPNGRYRVTLHFAELYRDVPQIRQFGVRLEGHWVLSNLDLAATVGRDMAHDESFEIDLADGQLGIEFEKQLDHPKVNAMEIEAIR